MTSDSSTGTGAGRDVTFSPLTTTSSIQQVSQTEGYSSRTQATVLRPNYVAAHLLTFVKLASVPLVINRCTVYYHITVYVEVFF